MSRYTKKDIIRMTEEEDVEFIRLQFTDIFGMLKNVAITAGQLEKALNNRCMFDGSAIEGFVRIEESDMYLYPDLDTFAIFPWRPQQGKVARLLCDVCRADGTPLAVSPREILKKTMEKVEKEGYTFQIDPECEFFLFHEDENGVPTTVTHEKAGYMDISPLDLGENARRDMVMTLEDMGFEIESSHHEKAPGQHEIDFRYAGAMETADRIVTFKTAVFHCKAVRSLCDFYAEAKGWYGRFRHAYQYFSVSEWEKYLQRSGSGRWFKSGSKMVHGRYYGSCQRYVCCDEPSGQLL